MTTSVAERLRTAFGSSLSSTANGRASVALAEASAQDSQSGLPSREIENEAGRCLLYEERYPIQHLHGGLELGACLKLPWRALACLAKDSRLSEIDLRNAVFLDTETTGLAGGTGTAAFLVGIGHFESATSLAPSASRSLAFVVRQFFMRDFAEERALLLALAEALAAFPYVITFNGKSFDLPLLETRYVLARLPRPRPPELHLDLLHPARRLWRERLQRCSLAVIEEAVLGHRRGNDIPSWLIPGLYVAYLQRGEVGSLDRVFSHNRHDLLSLTVLASHLGRRLAEPLADNLGPDELLGVARLYEEVGLREEACACLELALERADARLRGRLQLLLALYCKRAGRRERAVELWQALAAGPAPLAGLIELAKHHEHRQSNIGAALETVEQALAILEVRELREGPPRWRTERVDLERRLGRLLRKARGCSL